MKIEHRLNNYDLTILFARMELNKDTVEYITMTLTFDL